MAEEKDRKLHAVGEGEEFRAFDGDTGEVADGVSIEDIAEDETYGYELTGSAEQLSFDVKDEHDLRSASVKVPAVGQLMVKGQFQQGDRIKVLVELEVEHVSFPPIKHKGFRVGTQRMHHAAIIDATQA